jgi:pimeloyl-ACP methyl ester carboxylesterase
VPSPTAARPSAALATASPETPLFFEAAGRPLYAVYHAPAPGRADAPLLVQCHSLGVELVTNYRNEVLCARAAAAAGFPVFRYHARGHGDSAGDFAAVTFAGLVEDALAAADQGLARSGGHGMVWLGVRFGALVAAAALGARGARGLALWEPVEEPAEYFRRQLRGLLFSRVAKGERPDATVDELLARVTSEGQVDVHGYYLHRALVESVAGLGLAGLLAAWKGPTLLAQIQARPRLAPEHAALVEGLELRGARVAMTRVAEEPGWHFISNPAWESQALVRDTVEWLRAVA